MRSGERAFHGLCGSVAHARQYVGVGVQGYRYGGVAQLHLNELRVDATRQEQSRAVVS
jgi:hypothetical protein